MDWQDDPLSERVAALKHDLGKYCAWQSVNLGDEAWTGPVADGLMTALCSDLLATKTGTDGDRSAWELWDLHAAELPRPLDPPELADVEAAVEVLRAAEPALRSRDREAIGAHRNQIRQAQQTIRKALASAHRTLLRRADAGAS